MRDFNRLRSNKGATPTLHVSNQREGLKVDHSPLEIELRDRLWNLYHFYRYAVVIFYIVVPILWLWFRREANQFGPLLLTSIIVGGLFGLCTVRVLGYYKSWLDSAYEKESFLYLAEQAYLGRGVLLRSFLWKSGVLFLLILLSTTIPILPLAIFIGAITVFHFFEWLTLLVCFISR